MMVNIETYTVYVCMYVCMFVLLPILVVYRLIIQTQHDLVDLCVRSCDNLTFSLHFI